MSRDLYLGPGPFNEEPAKAVVEEYTAADQARGFGVPENQLVGKDTALYRKVEAANNEADRAVETGEVVLGGSK